MKGGGGDTWPEVFLLGISLSFLLLALIVCLTKVFDVYIYIYIYMSENLNILTSSVYLDHIIAIEGTTSLAWYMYMYTLIDNN